MIRVVIIDEQQLLIDALSILISRETDIEYLGGATTTLTGFEMVRETKPDVLILNLDLQEGMILDDLPCLIKGLPDMRIVVLTADTNVFILMKAIDLGISGILPKGCSLNELISTVRKTAQGEVVIPTSLLVDLLKRLPKNRAVMPHRDLPWERLTQREQEILNYLAKGNSGIEIAHRLQIAPLTVRTHIRNLMGKLGVHSRLEAVAFGIKHGLVNTGLYQH